MKTLNIELDDETFAAFEREAARTGADAAAFANAAVELALHELAFGPASAEDIAALARAVAEADRGEFASEAEMERLWAGFGR